jgi:hypothetical protein
MTSGYLKIWQVSVKLMTSLKHFVSHFQSNIASPHTKSYISSWKTVTLFNQFSINTIDCFFLPWTLVSSPSSQIPKGAFLSLWLISLFLIFLHSFCLDCNLKNQNYIFSTISKLGCKYIIFAATYFCYGVIYIILIQIATH